MSTNSDIGYNRQNACARDAYISFEPVEHRYIVHGAAGDIECESVTQLVSGCFAKFDADYHAARKATPTCTAEMLKEIWAKKGEEARQLGSLLHERIERYFLGFQPEAEAMNERGFRHFLDFATSHTILPYRSEWPVYSERYRLAGTLDFLAFDGQRFEIYDWKRSTKVVDNSGRPLQDNYGKYARNPIGHIKDTVFNHYSLQLSLYRYILKTEYGIDVAACHLGIFHPQLDRYHLIDTPYMLNEVEALLKERI